MRDGDVWKLIEAITAIEVQRFGRRYRRHHGELKARKILKRKVFRQAAQFPTLPEDEQRVLAQERLAAGAVANRKQITGLAQAKLAFVREVLELCERFDCRAFASLVSRDAPRPTTQVLRKDYAFLFERFFYFLEDLDATMQGAVVFDELEKSQAHILIGQMEEYFLRTQRGLQRSQQVIPEPFFVHSDLTSLVQVADLIAYVVAWGFRLDAADAPGREELDGYVEQISRLRYVARRRILGRNNFRVHSFVVIDDLRGWEDRPEPA